MLDGILYAVVGVMLITSFMKDRAKTQKTLMKAWKSFMKNIKMLVGMMILMGVVFTLINPNLIGQLFGEESGIIGILLGLGIGSATFIPSFIAFPLAALLIRKGARLAYVFLFLVAWTSVKLPLFMFELASLGPEFTFTHVITSMVVYFIGAVVLERVLSTEAVETIIEKSKKYA